MIYFLLIISLLAAVISSLALFVCIKRMLVLNEKLEEIGEQVDESLDILNDCYASFDTISKHDLMLDEPILHELMSVVKRSKESVLLVANKLVTFDDENEED